MEWEEKEGRKAVGRMERERKERNGKHEAEWGRKTRNGRMGRNGKQ